MDVGDVMLQHDSRWGVQINLVDHILWISFCDWHDEANDLWFYHFMVPNEPKKQFTND